MEDSGIGPRLALRLLRDGVPPSLLIDLLDPEGMERALQAEAAEAEVAREVALEVARARDEAAARDLNERGGPAATA